MLKDRALFKQAQLLLQEEIEQVGKLHELLQAETLALQNPDATSLADIVKQKVLPLAALAESQRARHALLQELQRPANEDAWRQLLVELDANAAAESQLLTPLLESLIDALALCRKANRVNDKIASRSQLSVKHLLNILRGNVADNKLYGATGNTVSIADTKPISAA